VTAAGGTPSVDNPRYWTEDGDGHAWAAIADMTREPRLKRTNRRVSEEGIRAARLPLGRPDTVLFAMYASLGAMAVLDVPATWNQAILGITPRPGTSVDFVRYALIDRRRDLLSLARSNTQANLNQEQVGNLRILVPALGIQRRIAQFLDRECARIMVAGTREADLAARLKPVPAQLFEADHQVRMAERVRLRFSLRAVEQGWSPQCEARLAEPGGWGVTKTGAANYGHFRPDEHKALPVDLRPLPEFELRVGDLVMSRANTRELAGSAARVRQLGGWRLLMCDKLYRLGVHDQVLDPEFTVLAINSREARRQIEASTSGASASMQNISQDVVRGLRLPRPSLADQRAIVARVNAASRDVARSMSIASELRAALTAYRSSLIHEAVTGKLDVTAASDRQMDERLHAAAEDRLDEVAAV
jgi:type I restriction enzyme S subunit